MATLLADPPSKPLWETRGTNIDLNLHAGQARAWASERRFVFMVAGAQGGKTVFGPPWLLREMRLRGPGDYLAVTATFPLLNLKMLPEFLSLFQTQLHLGEWRASARVFDIPKQKGKTPLEWDGAGRVIFGSATNSESLESATAKAAWLDECGMDQFRLASWEAVQRRLALYQGRVLGTTTPYNLGWLKQQIYDPWRAGSPDIDVIQFESIVNPAFPRAEYERLRSVMPTWKFNMFLRAQFDRPAGLIYADFLDAFREDGGHKVHAFDVPPSWPRHVGIDFGAANTALVWLAHDPAADVYYVYRESLEGGMTTGEHAAKARAVAQGANVLTWHGGSKSETQQRADWTAAGVPAREPPVSDVEAGIDRVISLFKTKRLFVSDSCRGLLDELGTYARELDDSSQPTAKIRDKESFHRLDALRYAILGVTQALPFGWIKLAR